VEDNVNRHFYNWFPLFIGLVLTLTAVVSANNETNGKDQNTQSTGQDMQITPADPMNRKFVPGDAVQIIAILDTNSFINGTYPIDDAGYVELPIYGKVRITQMTATEFTGFLLEKYKDWLSYPFLQVKPLIRLSVLGGVPRPGFYYFDQDYSLWEVMKMVGGTLDEDGLKQMKWMRNGESVQENLIPYIQSGVALKNISFQSGDQIWVRSPNKPGFFEKSRNFFSFVGAITGFFTLYLSYQRFIVRGR
jgi:protein involved in polysaccharide export with SLBB domain